MGVSKNVPARGKSQLFRRAKKLKCQQMPSGGTNAQHLPRSQTVKSNTAVFDLVCAAKCPRSTASHFVRAAATVSKQTTCFCFSFASFCTLVSIFHRDPDQDSVQEIYQTIVLYPRCHWSPQPFHSRLFTKCLSLRYSLFGAQYFSRSTKPVHIYWIESPRLMMNP